MLESTSFPIADIENFKTQVIHWANQFEVFLVLDNNQVSSSYSEKEFLIAIDATSSLKLTETADAFSKFDEFQKQVKSTIYGYFSYDLKNDLEQLASKNGDNIKLPELFFFEARYVLEVKDGMCHFNRSTLEAMYLYDQILAFPIPVSKSPISINWKSHVSKEDYIKKVRKIRQDIEEGDVYELNYCREIYAENVNFNSIQTFIHLNQKVKAPFTAFLKMDQHQVLSFSPERFMKCKEGKLLSQPIKGTIKKSSNSAENEMLKRQLFEDKKERAENVMIVDLVRNDFAKSSVAGSVKVDELFGIYEFENIIQMISTVSAKKRAAVSSISALQNAFPMGSMTGAPKIKAMELIEEYEQFKRGLYSGAIGYFTTKGDFDFSVVIRTLIYDESAKYLSFQVGGAITYESIPEKEWEETKIKADSILSYLRV